MTRVTVDPDGNRLIVLAAEDDGICEYCGLEDELRPYGKNYANICYDCCMKNVKTTEKYMANVLFGVPIEGE